jgi:IS30 family transposase
MPWGHLTREERKVIGNMMEIGYARAEVARALGRDRSTISRELRRNANSDGRFLPDVAHVYAQCRKAVRVRRPKTGDASLMGYVAERLERFWSPEQIAGRLRRVDRPGNADAWISHQTIYNWVRSDPARRARFRPFLRQGRKRRRTPYGSGPSRGQIKDRVMIDKRPPAVTERRRIGDWEGDTVEGRNHKGYVATWVERKSLYLVARKMGDKRAETLNQATRQGFQSISRKKILTLTVDNGKEFARFQEIERTLGAKVYFAFPYRSWERPINENTNGLLRQFIPKTMDLRTVGADSLARSVRSLNNRPRKTLGYRTPCEVLRLPRVALTI